MLFVVAAEDTLAPAALNALEQLESARARFVGAVLNGVDLQRNAFFYWRSLLPASATTFGAYTKSSARIVLRS